MYRFSRSASVVACFSVFAFCAAHLPAARGASQNAALFAPLRALASYLGLAAPILPQKPQKQPQTKSQTGQRRLSAVSSGGIRASALTLTVNDTDSQADFDAGDGVCETFTSSGICTLRAAMEEANQSPGADVIKFAITGGAAAPVIQPTQALPAITEAVTIDATTQSGFFPNGTPIVTLDGTNAGSGSIGLRLNAPACTVKGLCIVNFKGQGINVATISDSNTIQTCYIGVAADGKTAAANAQGIQLNSVKNLIGGITPTPGKGLGNVISGNTGLALGDTGDGTSNPVGNVIEGNVIGLSADQTVAVPNNLGIQISSRDNDIVGVSGNGHNVIAGNTTDGIDVFQNFAAGNDNNVIQGNQIGLNDNFDSGLGNGGDGIFMAGAGSKIINSNDIVHNGGNGITLQNATGIIIQGNNVGFFDGGNTGDGIFLSNSAKNNVIGGTKADTFANAEAKGNLISGNAVGVHVDSNTVPPDATGNSIRGNTIFVNSKLGIDLFGGTENAAGVTANDANDGDKGNNNLQNFPIITTISGKTINFTFNSKPNTTFALDFYDNSFDASGFGEGQTGLGSLTVTTDANGDSNLTSFTAPSAPTGPVSATATNQTTGDTSEFSNAVGALAPFTVNTTAADDDGSCDAFGANTDCTLPEAINAANARSGADTINFTISAALGVVQVIAPTATLPTITDPVTIDGYSQPFATPNTLVTGDDAKLLIELDGSSTSSASGLTIQAANCTVQGLVIHNFASNILINGAGATGNTIAGCFIGTNAAGTLAAANNGEGVFVQNCTGNTIGGTTAAARNIISGSKLVQGYGVHFNAGANNNVVQNNYIGTDVTGTKALPNVHGIGFGISSGNTIGGTTANAANIIAFNSGDGIVVFDSGSTGNAIRGNAIHNNGLLGIDFGFSGSPVPNDTDDGDGGPNNQQNFPVLSNVRLSSGNTLVDVSLNSAPGTYALDFFSNAVADPSGFGEGQSFLESDSLTIPAGATTATKTVTLTGNLLTSSLTSTATDSAGDTSEFSAVVKANSAVFVGPTPYLSKNDSPFIASINAGTTLLEDFEDGLLNTPGVSASTGNPFVPGSLTDSVDADDGAIDGSGTNGYSFFDSSAATGITFTFNAAALGGNLPTRAGIVWTDGSGTTTFEAFDSSGASLGQVGPVSISDGPFSFSGTTAEDRFFGVTNAGGISAIKISNTIGGMEVDHLQYSRATRTTFTVNLATDTDDGVCSATNCTLREAINAANAKVGADTIKFSIGTGVQTIAPATPLPVITERVTIDGTTQGVSSTPLIVLSGQNPGVQTPTSFAAALQIAADNCVVRSLCFNNNFPGGIAITGSAANLLASNNKVEGCFFGTNATGTAASILTGPAISLGSDGFTTGAGATNNIIGGTTTAQRNIINTNKPSSGFGVDIQGADTSGNRIIGNFIGTNAAGKGAIGNSYGVGISGGAHDNFIGGLTPEERNVISGNDTGILIYSNANFIRGNFIGTDLTGNVALANSNAGVSMDAGASGNQIGGVATTPGTGRGNVIAGNGLGVEIIGRSFGTGAFSSNNKVQGNLIGVKASGSGALANGFGIYLKLGAQTNIIGGTIAGQGNVISGNSNGGIEIENFNGPAAPNNTANNTIAGNFIGTKIDGLSGLPNSGAGISLDFQTSGNKIGLTGATGGNVISGQNIVPSSGLSIGQGCFDNTVVNNLIGTNKNGTAAVANQVGISIAFNAHDNTIGGATAAESNVVSGNDQAGIGFGDGANNNRVIGNFIGTKKDGTTALGNGGDGGISIGAGGPALAGAFNNSIGGTSSGQGNLIAFNRGDGVTINGDGATAAKGNSIRRNSIFSNGQLGIDLVGGLESNQVTKNDTGDGDGGANLLQNYPQLTSAINEAGGTRVRGTLNGPANTTYSIEFFDNVIADSSSFGQGEKFVSALANFNTGSTGTGTFSIVIPSVADGHFISATATSAGGDTSEFSKVVTVGAAILPMLSINNVRVNEGDSGTTNATFTVTLSPAPQTTVTVKFATTDGTAVAPGDYAAKTGTLTFAAGETTKTVSVTIVNDNIVEPDETFKVVLSAPSGATIADGTGLGTITNDDLAANFTVNSTDDTDDGSCDALVTGTSKDCTLREAINAANADAAPKTIIFAIPGSGVPTIILSSPLPPITQPVTIDGFSQNSSLGQPAVEINGNGRDYGLTLKATDCVVKGLIINLCNRAGVRITGIAAQNNSVQGCYVGTNAAGTSLLPNQDGVEISAGAKNNIIGGIGISRNLISGNFGRGVFITSVGTTGNQVLSNFIGTKKGGLSALSNAIGVEISGGAGGNIVGGTRRNFISGNDAQGILISGSNDNKVQDNYIGLDVNGSAALPNGGSGIEISGGAKNNLVGGATTVLRNVIAGNGGSGVLISGSGSDSNKVQGNYIGTNATGAAAKANGSNGITVSSGAKNNVIGGTTSAARNLISGNLLSGISLEGNATASNTVIGNRIGVATDGTTALPNLKHGVSIVAADNNLIGGPGTSSNLIANNTRDGVAVTNVGATAPAAGNRIRGNRIFNNTGLGIDLADNGVTLNDPTDSDPGPNGLQNFPTVTKTGQLGAGQPLQLTGTFQGASGRDLIIDVYANPSLSAEGKEYIGTFNVTTDSSGAANFALSVGDQTLTDLSNQFITLTATDSLSGDTSEFSKAFKVPASTGLVVTPPGVTPPTPISLSPCEQQQFTASAAGVPIAVRWTATGGTITPSNAGTVPVATIDYKAGSGTSFTLTATPPAGSPVSVTINVTAAPEAFFGWGYNAFGSVGDGTGSQRNAPVKVNLPSNPTVIAAGGSHSLAVVNGKLFAWGLNQDFQLGLGDQSNRTSPAEVTALPGTPTALACGFYHSLAVVNGEVYAWGYNRYGQCGQTPGTTDPHVVTPTKVPNLTGVVEVSAGYYFSIARTSNGDVYAWGNNLYGQCGPNASGTVQIKPVKVLSSASKIGAGAAHAAALVSGQVFSWGLNETGQLGNGTDGTGVQSATPVRAIGLSGMSLLAVGYAHTLAGNSSAIYSWGDNGKNELGRNGTTNDANPGAIAGLTGVTKLAAGSAHNLAVKSDGSLWSWGFNSYGSLGLSDTANRATPQQVAGLSGVSDIAAGYAHSFALGKEDLCGSTSPPGGIAQPQNLATSSVPDSGSALASSDSIVLDVAPSSDAPTFFRVTVNGRDVEVQGVQKSNAGTTLLLPTGTLKEGDKVIVTWSRLDGVQSLGLKAE